LKRVIALLLVLLASAGTAGAATCAVDFAPAATLLLPYFEVDIDNPGGLDTIFTINNASASAALTHVIVWTDLSVEALDFNVYLTGYDMQTVSLGLIIRDGIVPRTASAGQDPTDTISPKGPYSQDINFASCNGIFPYTIPALDADFLNHLQSILTGGPSSIYGGLCGGLDYGDNIARGYVTVDDMVACTLLTPCDDGYFPGVGGYRNILWGSWWMIDGGQNFAQGDNLVGLEAFSPGSPVPRQLATNGTFWQRCFADRPGDDRRESLGTSYGSQYFNNAAFAGGAEVLVWRDSLTPSAPGFSCSRGPSWFPLDQRKVIAFDEQENPDEPFCNVSPCPEEDLLFPAEAQRVSIADLELASQSGWMYLDLNHADGTHAQAYVVTMESAEGRYSAGSAALPFDTYCSDFVIPPGGF
jgi:hypothetical protein